jgi:hypothetical protein
MQLDVEGHEASEGDEVRAGDLIEQLARVRGAAKIGVGPEDFAGNGLLGGVEATDKGLGVDFLKLSQRFALGQELVVNAPIHHRPTLD